MSEPKIHKTHQMGKEYTDMRCPGSTPRFYGVRKCKICKAETIAHPAGKFTDDELLERCRGEVLDRYC